MRLPALVALGVIAFFDPNLAVASTPKRGPAYYEALMHFCYRGGLADRLGRNPQSRSTFGPSARQAALTDLRKARARGSLATTALCASGYYQAIREGYVTVVERQTHR
jgi:hypothetical protein